MDFVGVGYYLCFGEPYPGLCFVDLSPPSAAGLCEFGLLQNEHGDLWMVEIWTVSLNVSRVLQIDSYSLCLEAFFPPPSASLFHVCCCGWFVNVSRLAERVRVQHDL